MSKTILYKILFGTMLLAAITISAQTKKDYPEPEYPYKVYIYNEESNEVEAMQTSEGHLESTTLTQQLAYLVMGPASAVRITKKPKLLFLIKLEADKDPKEFVRIFKL